MRAAVPSGGRPRRTPQEALHAAYEDAEQISSGGSAWDTPPSACSVRPGRPTIQRLVLGSQLHRLREQQGITAEQAAAQIRESYSKISRIEHGRAGFKERDIAELLTFYGVNDGEERAALLNLAREPNTPGWWHASSDILPTWPEPYIDLEATAAIIRTYQIQFVPSLLQTEGYARALQRAGYPTASEEEIAQRNNVRVSRQDHLSRAHRPLLWAIVDEGALHRSVGGPQVMREQIHHLIKMADHPAVHLQILPLRLGSHCGVGGSFTILRFAEPDQGDVIYLEQLTSDLYMDRPPDVDRYLEVTERLCLDAEPATNTPGLLRKVLAEVSWIAPANSEIRASRPYTCATYPQAPPAARTA